MSSDDPIVQGHINAANAAEVSGDHNARATAATAALTAWKDAMRTVPPANPATPVEAGQRLDHLSKDAAWRNKFTAGDTAAVKEFNALNEQVASGDAVSLAIAGVAPPDSVDFNSGALPGPREQVQGVEHLRELGFSDANVEEIYRGELRYDDGGKLDEPATAMRVAAAEQWINRATKDADFRRRLVAGDQDAAAQFHRANAIIAAGKR
jgi:hypothetical protein